MKKYKPSERVNFYTKLAEDLTELHTKYGIIHGDLKLNNIMFKDEEMTILKLIDFGVSTKIGLPQNAFNVYEIPWEFLFFEDNLARPPFDAFGFAMLLCMLEYSHIEQLSEFLPIFKAKQIKECTHIFSD